MDVRIRGLQRIQLFAEEFVQKVRLIARVNARAEPEQIGREIPKAVDAASFPLTHKVQSLVGEICSVLHIPQDRFFFRLD